MQGLGAPLELVTYTDFAGFAGCYGGDFRCLQSANQASLENANQMLFQSSSACLGVFPVGPSLDGHMIKTLPAVAFSTGKWRSFIPIDFANFVKVDTGPASHPSSFRTYPMK